MKVQSLTIAIYIVKSIYGMQHGAVLSTMQFSGSVLLFNVLHVYNVNSLIVMDQQI